MSHAPDAQEARKRARECQKRVGFLGRGLVAYCTKTALGVWLTQDGLGFLGSNARRGDAMNMNKPRKRNPVLLVALAGIAAIFAGWLHFMSSLTGRARLDGGLGVLLGLYICS